MTDQTPEPARSLREIVEPLRQMSDREVKVNQYLAAVQAMKNENEAKSWRALEALLESESDRRAQVLAELETDVGGVA